MKKSCLSHDQKLALQVFSIWLDEKIPDKPFLLSGFAGSGKTFLATKFLKNVEEKNICWTVAAPTHKAVGVLRKVLDEEGLSPTWYPSTIHRLLRLKLTRKGNQEICEQTNQTAKSLDQLGLVLIDEASMLDSNLLEIILRCANTFKTRIVFIGDPAQLAPIGEDKSPVFFQERISQFFLQEVVRHQGSILKLANLVRKEDFYCIQPPCFSTIHSDTSIVGSLDPASWLIKAKLALRLAADENKPDHARILCYTNSFLERLVPHARRAIHGDMADEMSVLPGEVLITRRAVMTSASLEFTDSLEGTGILFGSNTELVVEDVKNEFFDWYGIDNEIGSEFNFSEINILIAKVCLDKKNTFIRLMPPLGSEQRHHLETTMNYLCNRAKALPKKDARRFWKMFFQIRDSFAYVGPASVLTVHRSQGSTFEEVFIASDVFHCNQLSLRKQLTYVAVSRASREVWFSGNTKTKDLKGIWLID